MTTSLMPTPQQRYFNNNGQVAAGCHLFTYAAGTSTPKATYTDSAGTIPHANPIVLDSKGEAVIYFSGNYKVDLKTAAGVQITGYPVDNYVASTFLADTLRTDLAASSGAGLMGTIRAGSGAAARTQESKNRDFVSVRDSSTTTVDGVTSNQTDLVAAVADAYTRGVRLLWPAGTYVSTANIPNFHDVEHFGNGVVKRGSDTFLISHRGTQTNTLYVATTGADANDGLSAAEPFLTTLAAGNTLYNWQWNRHTWKIQHAAGTYVQATTFSASFPCAERVQFLGAAVADGTTPTTIFDSPGGASKVGIFIQSKVRAYVEDIRFTDYADTGAPTVSGGGAAITADGSCELFTRNVWASNCDVGIECSTESQLRVRAGVLNANGVGIRCISNVTYTIGYGGTAADITGATGTAITNSTIAGFWGQEGATGHLDYCYIDTCAVGIDLYERSRSHLLGSQVRNNVTAGVRTRGASSIYNNPVTVNTFAGNAIDFLRGSYSYEVDEDNDSFGAALYPVRDPVGASTSSTSYVTAKTYSLRAGSAVSRGSGFSVLIAGDVLGVTDTKSVRVSFGAIVLGTFAINAATTDYTIEVKMVTSVAASSQTLMTTLLQNGVTPIVVVTAGIAGNMNIANNILVEHLVANAADSNRLRLIEISVIH